MSNIIKTIDAVKFIMKNGTLTGSRAWGLHKDDSDHDYYMPTEVLKEAIDMIDGSILQASEADYEVVGFYFFHGSCVFNIYGLDEQNLADYKLADGIMKSSIDNVEGFRDKVKDRTLRVEAYKSFLAISRATITAELFQNAVKPCCTDEDIPFGVSND